MKSTTENAPDIKKQETILNDQDASLSVARIDNNTNLTAIDLNNADLPDLDEADVIPLDLSSSYWTPKETGESKRVYFDAIKIVQVQDTNDKEVVFDLPCVFFFEKSKGEIKTFSNGSKRLVAIMERNHIERGTPILITYLGKKRNSTNQYMSDDWSVKPLVIKIGK